MSGLTRVHSGYRVIDKAFMVYDAALLDDISPEMFEARFWQDHQTVIGLAKGRGSALFIRHNDDQWVLRHYLRGGVVGRLIRDSYLWLGLTSSRAWQEWHLLMHMHNLGLPVPAPVAACTTRGGRLYRADLVTRRIEGARTWQEWMVDGPLPGDSWVALGKLLHRFHSAGVYHHDLNVRNILRCESGDLYLIDFDKARLRRPGGWQRANLARLLRSIRKFERQGLNMHFNDDCWGQLLQGYASATR